jgi:lipoprotein-anchoring transpeptidase ErfK/SrfK
LQNPQMQVQMGTPSPQPTFTSSYMHGQPQAQWSSQDISQMPPYQGQWGTM